MTLKSGTGQACAACKFQRRRCTAECLLAPFFPADQPKMFQNVHRLFGVKHVQNLLKELAPDQKPIAIKSIKFHAAMRDKHPVLGCVAEIQDLEYKIHLLQEELHLVLHHLNYYRHQQHHHQQQQQRDVSSMEDHFVSQLQLGVGPPGNNAASATPPPPPPPPMQYDNYDDDIHMDSLKQDVVIDDSFWMQQNYCYDDNNNNNTNNNNNFSININNINNNNDSNSNSMVVQSELSTSAHDYGEMHPFFENIDDTQSYIGSSFEPSERDSRQSIEQVAENELKSAAACFSLTSVN